jgi:acyl dehydratase
MAIPKGEFEQQIQTFVGLEIGPPEVGPDLVNEPMIRHWCEVLDDANPAYTDPAAAKQSLHGGIVAPPTMLQTWILGGFAMAMPQKEPLDKQRELHALRASSPPTATRATTATSARAIRSAPPP